MKTFSPLSLALLVLLLSASAFSPASPTTVNYTYDQAGRLSGAAYNGAAIAYTYDAAGNVLNASVSATGVLPDAVLEYYNASLDHYFITRLPAAMANLDAGNTPTKWTRTGVAFRTFSLAQATTSPVCRFYIPPELGDSHFFGRGTVECDATAQKNPTFILEDPAFMHMILPNAGVCPANTVPVYRVF